MPKLLSRNEAAAELAVSPPTITVMFKDGAFPNAYRVGKGGRLRIPLADIEAAKQRPFLQKEGA